MVLFLISNAIGLCLSVPLFYITLFYIVIYFTFILYNSKYELQKNKTQVNKQADAFLKEAIFDFQILFQVLQRFCTLCIFHFNCFHIFKKCNEQQHVELT